MPSVHTTGLLGLIAQPFRTGVVQAFNRKSQFSTRGLHIPEFIGVPAENPTRFAYIDYSQVIKTFHNSSACPVVIAVIAIVPGVLSVGSLWKIVPDGRVRVPHRILYLTELF